MHLVSSQRGHMGGGFIGFLFSGCQQQPGPRYYRDEPSYAPQQRMIEQPAQPDIDPRYEKQMVDYSGREAPGTIVIDTPQRFLYLVQPGGRLIYVTCSIFEAENQAQADLFLDANPLFRAIPIAEVWKSTIRGAAPPTDEVYLTLTPARNATDGFFVAVFEKVED